MSNQEQGRLLLGKIITKAWHNSAFEQRLLDDPGTVLKEEGIDVPSELEVRVVKNTASIIHIVIPDKPPIEEAINDSFQSWKVAGCNCWQGEAWN